MSASRDVPPGSSPSSAKSTSPGGSPALPTAARVADLVATITFLAATAVLFTGGGVWSLGGIRLSVRSPLRLFILTLLIVVVRHWFVRRPAMFAPLVANARQPMPLDEHQLFADPAEGWPRRLIRLTLVVLGFSALVAGLTWPQVARLDSVPDLGDPLFSIWRIAWISHQLPRNPLTLFDANIFHPESLTFTYSDPVLVPGVMSAPFFWLGVPPIWIYNVLFLSGFVLSGVTMFLLVRALTGRLEAAMVAGAIFAVYPYRFEHYSHLELQMTMWMPLAAWGLHRAIARGELRDGLLTGLAFALQMLSSLYYGLFLAVYFVVLGGALWLGRGRPLRPVWTLAAGAALAGALVAPVASRYIANKPMMGDRDVGTIRFYSAKGPDYLTSHDRSRVYLGWSRGGNPERQLFPRLTPVVLSAVALWPPLSVARIGYAAALAVTLDASLGLNGGIYPWLHEYISPFRGLRVPARFAVLVGLTLSILAGYGAARLLRRWPRQSVLLTAAMLTAVVVEALPRMHLERVWLEPPPIYEHIPSEPKAVLAEFPMPVDGLESWLDTRYLYFSTWHWHRLVNGNSGFFPPSYEELLARVRTFPSDDAVSYLKARGVQYVTVHGAFMRSQERYRNTLRMIDDRPDLELVAAVPWEGSESRLYRLRPESGPPASSRRQRRR